MLTCFSVADLCCSWICVLERSGRGHFWLPLRVRPVLPPHCLWSFPLLFPGKVAPKENFTSCFLQLTLQFTYRLYISTV